MNPWNVTSTALVNHCSDGVWTKGCRSGDCFLIRFTEWDWCNLPRFPKKNDPNVGKYDIPVPLSHLGYVTITLICMLRIVMSTVMRC